MSRQKAVLDAISKVMHPAINCSLAELGIVKDVEVYDEQTVILTFVFPFQKIPIKDKLIAAVENAIKELGYKPEYIIRYMNESEKKRFLELETKNWNDKKKAAVNCQP